MLVAFSMGVHWGGCTLGVLMESLRGAHWESELNSDFNFKALLVWVYTGPCEWVYTGGLWHNFV